MDGLYAARELSEGWRLARRGVWLFAERRGEELQVRSRNFGFHSAMLRYQFRSRPVFANVRPLKPKLSSCMDLWLERK